MNPQDPTQRMREILRKYRTFWIDKDAGTTKILNTDQALTELSNLMYETERLAVLRFETELRNIFSDRPDTFQIGAAFDLARIAALQQPNPQEEQ